jgi:hypothetical protein
MPRGGLPRVGRDILSPGELAPYNQFGAMPYDHRGNGLVMRRALMGQGMGMGNHFDPWARRNLPHIGGWGHRRRGFPGPFSGFGDNFGGSCAASGYGSGGCGRTSFGRSRRAVAMPWAPSAMSGGWSPRRRRFGDFNTRMMMDPGLMDPRTMDSRPPFSRTDPTMMFVDDPFGFMPRVHRRPKKPPLYINPRHTRHRFGPGGSFRMAPMGMRFGDEFEDDDFDQDFYPPSDFEDDYGFDFSDDEDGHSFMGLGRRHRIHGGRFDYDD